MKKKQQILILSILNMLATFLPYGILSNGKNVFLWKQFGEIDEYQSATLTIIDVANKWSAFAVYASTFLLLCSAIIYFVCADDFTVKIVKCFASVCMGTNLFFCYHIYEHYTYKYISVGALVAIALCAYMIMSLSGVRKRKILIVGVAILLTFPSFIVKHGFDIEASIEIIPYSLQMYFYALYSNWGTGDVAWIAVIPSLLVIATTIVAVISTLCEFKKKSISVYLMLVSCVIALAFDVLMLVLADDTMYILATYPIAIGLLVAYLILDKKKGL